ncbi:MAG: hypothetical protein ABSF67_11700 [Roseiarcus sp.]
MQLHPNLRFFRLADGGVTCGPDGLFVGGAPMLRRAQSNDGGGWTPRSVAERDEALGEVYGLPIDSAAKQGRLAAVARALDRGDLALASMGAVLLRFPDPPALSKDAPPRGSAELAAQLAAEGLLKADWDSSKHPRLGGPPNPGWFAATDAPSPPATRDREAVGPEAVGDARAAGAEAPTDAETAESEAPEDAAGDAQTGFWTWRRVLTAVRDALKSAGEDAVKTGRFVLWGDLALKLAIEVAIETLSSTPASPDEQRTIDQTDASFDPPKTLDELRHRPTRFRLGYERHHIVEQNPANLAKSPLAAIAEKFGRAALEDPRNIVWIPRTKHELITGYFNGKDQDDPAGRIRRRVVGEMDFEDQFQAGLGAMRLFGVLQ